MATPEEHPLVFGVDLFYKILIPLVLGGMGFLVVLDFSWRVRTRVSEWKNNRPADADPAVSDVGSSDPLPPEHLDPRREDSEPDEC
jgi:hypothetical protein